MTAEKTPQTLTLTVPEKQRYELKTYSGAYFDLFAFQAESVRLIDIARALSRTPRYRTNTERFYSVAEHCLIMAQWALLHRWDARLRLWLIMHDAAEAYTGDLPGPVKEMLGPIWDPMEERILSAVMRHVLKLALPLAADLAPAAMALSEGAEGDLGRLPPQVEDLDVGVRVAEGDLFFPGQDYLQHYLPHLEAVGGSKEELVKIGMKIARELDAAALRLVEEAVPASEARMIAAEEALLSAMQSAIADWANLYQAGSLTVTARST